MSANLKKYSLAVMIGACIGVAALVITGMCGNNYGQWTIPVFYDEGLDFVPERIAELERTAIALRIAHLFVEHGTEFLLVPMLAASLIAYLWIEFPQLMAYPEKASHRGWLQMLDNCLYGAFVACFIGFMMGHCGVLVLRNSIYPPGSLGCALACAAHLCFWSFVYLIVPFAAALISTAQASVTHLRCCAARKTGFL